MAEVLPNKYPVRGHSRSLPVLHPFSFLPGMPPNPHSSSVGFPRADITFRLCGRTQDSDSANQSAAPSGPQDLSRNEHMTQAW